MAFPPTMITVSEAFAAAPASSSKAAGGGETPGLFQTLLAGAAQPAAQSTAANPASPTAALFGGALTLLLQGAEPQAADAAPAQPVAAQATPTPTTTSSAKTLFGAPPVPDKPAAPPINNDAVVQAAAQAETTSLAVRPASTTTPEAAPQASSDPVRTPDAGAPAAAAPPAPTPAPVASTFIQAAFAASPVATTQNPAQASVAASINPEAVAASPEPVAVFKKAILANAADKPAGSSPISSTPAADVTSALQGKAIAGGDMTSQTGSPLSGFDAPRAAAEPMATPVARAPHGAAAMQVAHSIGRHFEGKSASFEVRLDPAELGRVDVKITVDHDKRVTAMVSADNPQTLTDLRGSARDIERALNEAGLDLAQGGLAFDLNHRQAESDEFDATPYAAGEEEPVVETAAFVARPFGMERWSRSGVDVWA